MNLSISKLSILLSSGWLFKLYWNWMSHSFASALDSAADFARIGESGQTPQAPWHHVARAPGPQILGPAAGPPTPGSRGSRGSRTVNSKVSPAAGWHKLLPVAAPGPGEILARNSPAAACNAAKWSFHAWSWSPTAGWQKLHTAKAAVAGRPIPTVAFLLPPAAEVLQDGWHSVGVPRHGGLFPQFHRKP